MSNLNATFCSGFINELLNDLVLVEGGSYQFSYSADQEYWDTLTVNDFYMCKYEVTQELWTAVMGSNPSMEKGWNTPKVPVNCITREDCDLFIQKLQELSGISYRLPRIDEWFYAANGGKYSKGFIYSGSNNIEDVAWYGHIDDGMDWPKKVGQKKPNELGIYDMSGNVWEYVQEYNPEGQALIFGGCISAYDFVCRTSDAISHSYALNKNEMHRHIGLRLIVDTE